MADKKKITNKPIPPMSVAEIEKLKDAEFYPVRVLAAAFGFSSTRPVMKDYRDEIIDHDECRLTGRGALLGPRKPFRRHPRGKAASLGLQIRGREIKRLALKEGRLPKAFTLDLGGRK
jgi:hypothetical protein